MSQNRPPIQNQGMPPQGQNAGQFPGRIPPQTPPSSMGMKQPPKQKKPKKSGSAKWVWLGILLMLLLIVGGVAFGYSSGIRARKDREKILRSEKATEQFQLAMLDIENENYAVAKSRLEYVLQVDSNFPNALQKYNDVMVALAPKETPTPYFTPTPGPTATPDLRGEEEMLITIKSHIAAKEWQQAIDGIEALRNKNIEYKTLEVDSLYYIALRSLGMVEIGQGYLEPGIYKITLAESFGPIDREANGLRLAARNYLAGAGFWEIDWLKAREYYANVNAATPGLFDKATGMTAAQRFAKASFALGDRYFEGLESEHNACLALDYYNEGLTVLANDIYAEKKVKADLECHPVVPTTPPDNAPPAPDIQDTIEDNTPLEIPNPDGSADVPSSGD